MKLRLYLEKNLIIGNDDFSEKNLYSENIEETIDTK